MDTEENIETPIMFYIIKIILYIIGFVIVVITFLSIINYLLDIYYYIKELIITNENLYDVYSLRLKDINNYRLINYIKMFNEKSDDKIIKFNNEEDKCYDIKNLNLEITRDSRFAPILKVNFDFAFKVDNPGIIWVIENLNSKGFSYYRSTLRDKKIDYLLN